MKVRRGLTLVEILTVLSITTVLMSITVPAVSKVRRQARSLKGMNNLRQIVLGVNIYANDNGGSFPISVATKTDASDGSWRWEDPRMMTACKSRPSKKYNRSMSSYLKSTSRMRISSRARVPLRSTNIFKMPGTQGSNGACLRRITWRIPCMVVMPFCGVIKPISPKPVVSFVVLVARMDAVKVISW